jgi:hypothetical protein
MPKHRRISYANEKIGRTLGQIKKSFVGAVGIEVDQLSVEEVSQPLSSNVTQKALPYL